ncbi:MAG: winged helix-turn-helix transcriptional regulator [Clostridia bacterium]|nr:winged helix-turn-helix transcriptional regulator [Clostridia bacterium]MBQ7120693.1 winged helix-turn-helix transcriptional regulator [Clostridia bacterium]
MDNIYHKAAHNLCRVSLLNRYRIMLALSGLKIYRGQPEILGYLLSHGDCSQKELADSLGVSPASIATSLKRMSKAGFIERAPDENDRRINRLKITPAGKEVFFAGKAECDKVDKIMFTGFSDDEIGQFSDMLSKIANNLSGDGISDKEVINYIKNQRNGDDKND